MASDPTAPAAGGSAGHAPINNNHTSTPSPLSSSSQLPTSTATATTPRSTSSQPDLIESTAGPSQPPPVVDIRDLLRRLWPQTPNHAVDDVTPDEISEAVAHFFTDRIDDVQTGALLMCLHFTGLDRHPAVLSQCAQKMLGAAAQVDSALLRQVVETRGRKEGGYQGGFVCHCCACLVLSCLLSSLLTNTTQLPV